MTFGVGGSAKSVNKAQTWISNKDPIIKGLVIDHLLMFKLFYTSLSYINSQSIPNQFLVKLSTCHNLISSPIYEFRGWSLWLAISLCTLPIFITLGSKGSLCPRGPVWYSDSTKTTAKFLLHTAHRLLKYE